MGFSSSSVVPASCRTSQWEKSPQNSFSLYYSRPIPFLRKHLKFFGGKLVEVGFALADSSDSAKGQKPEICVGCARARAKRIGDLKTDKLWRAHERLLIAQQTRCTQTYALCRVATDFLFCVYCSNHGDTMFEDEDDDDEDGFLPGYDM